GLSAQFAAAGLRLGRLKTGTPPRIEARSIDFGRTEVQPGSRVPLWFSFEPPADETWRVQPPAPWYPEVVTDGWRVQMPCYSVRTNGATHAAIRANLHRAPMFNGLIEGTGPRYCPSIEDKIVRFAEKDAHPLFLEPEGFTTASVYVQGANTSLPEDVQDAVLRTIPALAAVKVLRYGYAVEYDFVPPDQTTSWLECKRLPGLFLAGQINGTSGYEEAAGQGLIAGINAALAAGPSAGSGTAPPNGASTNGAAAALETTSSTAATLDRLTASNRLVLPRDLAYIGVMIDDLTTTEHREPYRLHTSRAEYRLLLRQDTAHFRLTPIGYRLRLIGREVYERTERQRDQVATVLQQVRGKGLGAAPELNARLRAAGLPPVTKSTMALAYLRRPEVGAVALAALGWEDVPPEIADHVLTEIKYEGFIARQAQAVARTRQLEHHCIPDRVDYQVLRGLRTEAQEQLSRFRPATVGQAARIAGVTPADISVLLVHLHAS
ncbi:MAG: FAD-dependent oxidoreductase, partial [Chloroflexota bacterium]|nr:FAD-dependent oxidoreductase [Chloroflexota bacterium]